MPPTMNIVTNENMLLNPNWEILLFQKYLHIQYHLPLMHHNYDN